MHSVSIYAINREFPGWMDSPKYIYIGRQKQYQNCGNYGNPHPVKPYICNTCTTKDSPDIVHQNRREAVEAYRNTISEQLKVKENRKDFAYTAGGKRFLKIMVCHCPKTDACHADVIREWLLGKQETLF